MQNKANPHNKVKNDWRSRGFSFEIFTDPPGQVWSNYVHTTDELVMLFEGEMILEMQGKKILCEIGREILIPANTHHTVRNVGETTSRWFYGYKNR